MRTLDKYLVFSIAIMIIYTIAEMFLSSKVGFEHSALTAAFFGVFGGEIFSCLIIKVFKIKKGGDSNEPSGFSS